MLFRFSEVPILDNGEYDYDNAKYIGTIVIKIILNILNYYIL